MHRLILVLLLAGCASERPSEPRGRPGPVLYVTFDCDHPEDAHVLPGDVELDPAWPPSVCLGERR